jgi:hypothetical protein
LLIHAGKVGVQRSVSPEKRTEPMDQMKRDIFGFAGKGSPTLLHAWRFLVNLRIFSPPPVEESPRLKPASEEALRRRIRA